MELGRTLPQSLPYPLHEIICALSWFQHPRPAQCQQIYHTYHNRTMTISGSLHMAGYVGSWPGRNRKSKRMCSFSVNSTFSLKNSWDHSPRGLPPLNFVTLLIILFFYIDPDSGWLILGRTVCIPLSFQEKLFLAWLLTHAEHCAERMVTYSNARDTGISWKGQLLHSTV